jgi:VWFA-related protein
MGFWFRVEIFALGSYLLPSARWADDVPKFSSSVQVVSLLASVRDAEGRIMPNLTKDDFALAEDGIPQTIRYFSRDSGLPLKICLLIDTSRSQTEVLAEEKQASAAFLDQVLREGKDQACVLYFDERVETLQGFSTRRQDLHDTRARLSIPDQIQTLLCSAVRDSSENIMKNQTETKAFIVLTDGVAYKDPRSLETAI